jgi:hypothetical protein
MKNSITELTKNTIENVLGGDSIKKHSSCQCRGAVQARNRIDCATRCCLDTNKTTYTYKRSRHTCSAYHNSVAQVRRQLWIPSLQPS